jgi:hypothetical protein
MIPRSVTLALCLTLPACRSSEAKSPIGTCDGKPRPALDCSTEFAYDSTKLQGGFEAMGLANLNASSEQTALRAIDRETAHYVAQSRRLCDEYNKCVLSSQAYATRSENLRRRMAQVPELYDSIRNASTDEARRVALESTYRTLVPDEARTELQLSFSVVAQKPGELTEMPVREGASLPTETHVAFFVTTSRPAYLYLAQKSETGQISLLFPDPRISQNNPIPPSVTLQIPPGGAHFRLDERDVGTERVYIIAALEPIASLDQAVIELASGTATPAAITRLLALGNGSGCRTRALSLEQNAAKVPCIRQRGLVLDGASGSQVAPVSAVLRTEAADDAIARVFSFKHVR